MLRSLVGAGYGRWDVVATSRRPRTDFVLSEPSTLSTVTVFGETAGNTAITLTWLYGVLVTELKAISGNTQYRYRYQCRQCVNAIANRATDDESGPLPASYEAEIDQLLCPRRPTQRPDRHQHQGPQRPRDGHAGL